LPAQKGPQGSRGAGQAIAVGGNRAAAVNTACDIRDNLIDSRSAALNTGIAHRVFEYVSLMSNGNTLARSTIINASRYRRR
jgi:hypothetical protein